MNNYVIALIVVTVGTVFLYTLYRMSEVYFEASHGASSVKLKARERPKNGRR